MCVCHHGNPASRWNGDFWSKVILLIFENLYIFFGVVSMTFLPLEYLWVLGFLQTSLLCILGELAGGGSAAVGVGVIEI